MTVTQWRQKFFEDWLGMFFSLLCLIHCLFLPLLMASLPAISLPFIENESVHFIILTFSFLIGFWAFGKHYPVHKSLYPPILGGLGLIILLFSGLLESKDLSSIWGYSLSGFGGFLLITGHWLNIKYTRHQMECRAASQCKCS